MRISDWSSDVCSSDLALEDRADLLGPRRPPPGVALDLLQIVGGTARKAGLVETLLHLRPDIGHALQSDGMDTVGCQVERRVHSHERGIGLGTPRIDRKSTRLNSSH